MKKVMIVPHDVEQKLTQSDSGANFSIAASNSTVSGEKGSADASADAIVDAFSRGVGFLETYYELRAAVHGSWLKRPISSGTFRKFERAAEMFKRISQVMEVAELKKVLDAPEGSIILMTPSVFSGIAYSFEVIDRKDPRYSKVMAGVQGLM